MLRSLAEILLVLSAIALISLAAGVPATHLASSAAALPTSPGQGSTGWRLAPPVMYRNLTLFPVVSSQDANTSDFATLDESLARGDVVISEQGDYLRRTRDGRIPAGLSTGPQVNQLMLINHGKQPVLLLAGEVVSGGKQDRIIGKDRIVPVGAASGARSPSVISRRFSLRRSRQSL